MRGRKILPIVAVFVTAVSISVPAAASDEILLTGGDRLVGEIIERTGDVVVLSHPVLGRLEVPVEDLRLEGLLGADLAWRITDRQSLEAWTRFHPDLGNASEFRAVSSISWSWLVNDEAKMSLHTGVEHEYQSVVDPGNDHNDWRIVAGLQFDF